MVAHHVALCQFDSLAHTSKKANASLHWAAPRAQMPCNIHTSVIIDNGVGQAPLTESGRELLPQTSESTESLQAPGPRALSPSFRPRTASVQFWCPWPLQCS
jgi:hypothetical protein